MARAAFFCPPARGGWSVRPDGTAGQRGGSPWHPSKFKGIEIWQHCPLYARITTSGSPEWRLLGRITPHLRRRAPAAASRGANCAARSGTPVHLTCRSGENRRVTFGVSCAVGVIDTIAVASVTSAVARAIRELALGLPRVPRSRSRLGLRSARDPHELSRAWMCCAEDEKESARAARAEARSARRGARTARIVAQQYPAA